MLDAASPIRLLLRAPADKMSAGKKFPQLNRGGGPDCGRLQRSAPLIAGIWGSGSPRKTRQKEGAGLWRKLLTMEAIRFARLW
jgi:hypothetical protein